jgi:phosphatidylglycerophosphate synthase
VIRQAALYLATADDLDAALRSVAGRPVAFHALLAALRAGVSRIGVPRVFRGTELEPAIAGSRRASAATVWLDAGTLDAAPTLLVPAAALAGAPGAAAILAASPAAVLAPSVHDGAPLLGVDAATSTALAEPLRRGAPLADSLARLLKSADVQSVAPEAWYVRVRDARSAAVAENALFRTLGSPIDTQLDRALHRRLSRHVTRAAIALGVTPNQISLASLVVGLGAAVCFWNGGTTRAVLGLLMYVAAVVLDHADGEVARLRLAESALGEWLDIVVDTVVHAAVVMALGVTTQTLTGSGAGLGIASAVGFVGSAAVAKLWPVTSDDDTVGSFLQDLGSRDGFYAMLVLFIVGRALAPAALPWLMIVVALGAHAYWVARGAYTLRRAWLARGGRAR